MSDRKSEELENAVETIERTTTSETVPALAKAEKSRKMNKYEIENRRRQVAKLRMKRLSIPNIAKLLHTSEKTVERDLDAIAEENRQSLAAFAPEDFLAEDKAFYEELLELGFQEFLGLKAGTPHRMRILDFLRATRNDRRQAYKDCGFIAEESNINIKSEAQVTLPWSPEIQKEMARVLLENTVGMNQLEPAPDLAYLEGEIVEDKPETVNVEGIEMEKENE